MAKVRLTDRNVQAATAQPGERLELFDQKAVGLILRVSDSGLKSWAVRYRTIDGQQRRHALGRYPDLSLGEARDAAAGVLKDSRTGKDPSAEAAARKRETRAQPLKTMRDLHDAYFLVCESGEWRPRKKRKRASTIAEERALWRRHIASPLNDLRVEEIDQQTIKRILRSLVAAGHGITSNRVRALIRQVLNFAIAEDRISINPVDKVAALAAEMPRQRVLSDDDLRTVWTTLSNRDELARPGPQGLQVKVRISEAVSIALKLQTMTLTRRSEITGMARAELDLANGSWIIPGDRTKNGVTHLVPLPSAAIALIRRAIVIADEGRDKPSSFVFPSPRDRDRPIRPPSLSHAMRDLRLALGIADIRTHDLRRTAASIMASERLKISPFLIGRVLNHTTEKGGAAAVTTTHYAIYDYASEKRAALEEWVSILLQIVGEVSPDSKVVSIRGVA